MLENLRLGAGSQMDTTPPATLDSPPKRAVLQPYLEALGYQVFERENHWHECLLTGHGEGWSGQGARADDAFYHVLRAAFPSHGARAALHQAALYHRYETLGLLPTDEATAPPLAPPSAMGETPGPDARGALPTTGAQGLPGAAEGSGASEEPLDEHALLPPTAESRPRDLQPAQPDATDRPRLPSEEEPPDGPQQEPPSVPILASPVEEIALGQPRPGPDEEERIREELDDLLQEIDGKKAPLAALAPNRQRLVLLGWLSRARALQDQYPRSIPVAVEVGRMVKILRSLSEAWWPGMISAFQIRARPMDSTRDLRPFVDWVPMSWEEVAEATNAALRLLEEQAEDFRDEDGWADMAQLQPPPPAADWMLTELEAEIEEVAPLGTRQPKDVARPDDARLLDWAQRLRWLRQEASDTALWGALAGRLRYWAQGASAEVRQVLDPSFRPGRSWATLVRSVVERAREEEELEKVLSSAPAPDANDERILEWLNRALPLGATHMEAILARAIPIGPRILRLDQEGRIPASERRDRRRLQKLLERLRPEDAPVAQPRDPAAPPLPSSQEPDTLPSLLEKTRGQRVLFVSNRSDSLLQERLLDAFQFGQLDWTEATPRRVEAATEAIASGTYDMVLGATGFLSHKEDGRLSRVCKSAGVPYVRTNRGRPAAVQLALARDLLGLPDLAPGGVPS